MSFISVSFYIFLSISLICYYTFPITKRWIVLLLSSLIFYAFCDFRAFGFIFFTSAIVYFTSRQMQKINDKENDLFLSKDKDWLKQNKKDCTKQSKKQKKKYLLLALLSTLIVLFAVKYLPSILISTFKIDVGFILPLGISFYTFQCIGYIIDIFYKKTTCEKNFFKLLLFISFFPQIVQGPISKANDLMPQLVNGNKFNYQKFVFGLQLILWGLLKKLIIGDILVSITSTVLNDVYSFSGGTLFLTLVLSYMQLYGDFSGGIDIARGVGECFGITITKNFNNPFLSTSLTDYWRRWHISLGAFMKDYVMMPLNLSKPMIKIGKFSREKFGMKIGKLVPVFISTFVVFFLVGIWHGPNLKYLIFGLYNGIITSCETIYKELTNKKQNKNNVFNKVSSHIYALFVMFIANLISYSQDVYGISYSIKSMFTNFTFNTDLLTTLNVNIMYFIVPVVTFFFVILTEQSREGKSDIRQVVAKQNIFVQYLIFIAIIIFILIYSSYASGQGGFAYAAF